MRGSSWILLLCLVELLHNTPLSPAEFWTDRHREAREVGMETSALFPTEALQKVSWMWGVHGAPTQDRVEKSQASPIGKDLGWTAKPSQPNSTASGDFASGEILRKSRKLLCETLDSRVLWSNSQSWLLWDGEFVNCSELSFRLFF